MPLKSLTLPKSKVMGTLNQTFLGLIDGVFLRLLSLIQVLTPLQWTSEVLLEATGFLVTSQVKAF